MRKYILLYKPPIKEFDENNPDTWHKVYHFDTFECPSKLDVAVKIGSLISEYNMKREYLSLEIEDDDE